MAYFNKQPQVQDYVIRTERLCIPFGIVHNATPASKTTSTDLPAALVLSTEGLTAVAAAIDADCNFTTPQDASSAIFGILVYNLGTVQKLHKAEVVNASAGSVTLAFKGASTTGVTASGNIALSATWGSNALSTTSLTAVLCIDFIVSKN